MRHFLFMCMSLLFAARVEATPQFIQEWPTHSDGIWGVAVGTANRVYVTDELRDVVVIYSTAGESLGVWGGHGSGPGEFLGARGICCDLASGDVYVSDNGNRIQRFTASGEFLAWWDQADGQPLSGPFGLAFEGGQLWVADMYNSAVHCFTPNGELVRTWGDFGTADSLLYNPIGIAVSGDHVYLADYSLDRMQEFDSMGQFIRAWGSTGSEPGQFQRPAGICLTPVGDVLVTEWDGHRIQRFASDGTFKETWGSFGFFVGELKEPKGIACDALNNTYVVDTNNFRIQVFGPGEAAAVPDGMSGVELAVFANATAAPLVTYSLARAADVDIRIYDVLGRESACLVNGRRPDGHHAIRWPAAARNPGVYYVRLRIGTSTLTRSAVRIN